MFLPELGSFVAAMLFAVHPIHTEAVSIQFYDCSTHHFYAIAQMFAHDTSPIIVRPESNNLRGYGLMVSFRICKDQDDQPSRDFLVFSH